MDDHAVTLILLNVVLSDYAYMCCAVYC